ncbi:N-acetyl-gamma-glutamyl-phosphate reductase [Coralliovum pocilloporae]|uniref:N-acetyl-gamma-glutamyl-phosphate reductase n=1 Tax=Coralliovum pocilloporae TaxID=3066369 RepID=UPI0033076A35
MTKIRVGVLGASGYTGADLVRLAVRHPNVEITVLTANSHAGKPMAKVFPHLGHVDLPDLVTIEEADWGAVDAVFCGLPHGTTQGITKTIFDRYPDVKIIDMSADFRLRNVETYADWYGGAHRAPEIQPQAVYGLTEHYRDEIKGARLVACPGCYPTAALMALLPITGTGLVDASDIVIDAKSGVSGAGRGLKENTLFCEAGEGLSPYSVAKHRHAPEIEQEVSRAAGSDVFVNFTPHLIPMSRGELCTSYVKLKGGATAADLRKALADRYAAEPFVRVVDEGIMPGTQHVRGSNYVLIGVFEDRIPGRAIVISTLDNLVKGSSGQALQNMNVVFGLEETTGLEQLPMFP